MHRKKKHLVCGFSHSATTTRLSPIVTNASLAILCRHAPLSTTRHRGPHSELGYRFAFAQAVKEAGNRTLLWFDILFARTHVAKVELKTDSGEEMQVSLIVPISLF